MKFVSRINKTNEPVSNMMSILVSSFYFVECSPIQKLPRKIKKINWASLRISNWSLCLVKLISFIQRTCAWFLKDARDFFNAIRFIAIVSEPPLIVWSLLLGYVPTVYVIIWFRSTIRGIPYDRRLLA